MKIRKYIPGLTLLAVAVMSRPVSGEEVALYAAASLTDSVKEATVSFEKQTGLTVRLNFGASGTLALQIEQHAPADVFFSADEANMDRLEHSGLVRAGTRRKVLANTLVVIVPANSTRALNKINDLANSQWKRLALGQPDTVPAGVYARKYLTMLGLWDELKGKVVPTENVRAALAAVESENADAGMVYKTDALISRKAKIALEVPRESGPAIVYPMAVLKDAANPEAAQKLEDFLSGNEARAIFQKFGFTFPK